MSEAPTQLEQQKKMDTLLNKTLIDLVVYSGIGFTAGMAASIFFKNKSVIRNVWAGVGGSYGFMINKHQFKQFG